MFEPANVILIALGLPFIGAVLLAIGANFSASFARQSALVTSVLTMIAAGFLVWNYPPDATTPFAQVRYAWLGAATGIDIQFALGLDGLSVWLFGLASLLVFTCVLASWKAIQDRPAAFYSLLLFLEFGMLGVFAAQDIILFYIFFEFTLIPLFFLIGIWGSNQRRYAAIKFFIFTLVGSMLTLVGLLALVVWNQQHPAPGTESTLTFSIAALTDSLRAATAAGNGIPIALQVGLFLALFAGFAIKVPLFPLHTWLPLAHTEAPTAGSVLLAGVLLKIGTYGFLRFSMPMLPEATALLMPYLLWLSVAGIIYGALVALVQTDIKKMIAYSSVSHLGFCMLGIFSLNRLGTEGGALQMVNHGLSTGGLFACIGMLYERYHTRQISDYSGMARRLPVLAFFMLVFTFSSIGLPGLNGFAGEFLLLLGAFQRGFTSPVVGSALSLQIIAVLAVLGVVLGAWYMLWLVQRTFFGPLKEPSHGGIDTIRDLSFREIAALTPLVVFIVWIGLQPETFLKPMRIALEHSTTDATAAYDAQLPSPSPVEETTRVAENFQWKNDFSSKPFSCANTMKNVPLENSSRRRMPIANELQLDIFPKQISNTFISRPNSLAGGR